MTKRVGRVAMEPSSSSSHPVLREEARATLRIQILVQDYKELVKETQEKLLKLQREKRKMQQLSAEVKFLRKKYKSLVLNPSQKTPNPLKTKSRKTPYPPKNKIQTAPCLLKNHSHKPYALHNVLPRITEIENEPSLPDRTFREKEPEIPRAPAVLDLNQVSLPNGEKTEFQVEWEPLALEKASKRYSSEADPVASDLMLSVCRDVGSGTSRLGKRKISWEDQVALRV